MSRSPAQLLETALRADPSRPFVTFYDETTGERIELSVATFANWVAKTANLLVDGLGLAPGDVVRLHLPRHWQTPVWTMAAWSAGLTVDLVGDPAAASLAVCGPEGVAEALRAPDVVALSLRALGAPFPADALPPGVYDYGREVAGYGDRFGGVGPLDPSAPLIIGPAGPHTLDLASREAVDRAATWGLIANGRLLLGAPLDPVGELLATTLLPLLLGGSVVIVKDAAELRLAAIAAAERSTAQAVAVSDSAAIRAVKSATAPVPPSTVTPDTSA